MATDKHLAIVDLISLHREDANTRTLAVFSDYEFGQRAALMGRPMITFTAIFQMPPAGGASFWKQTIIRNRTILTGMIEK